MTPEDPRKLAAAFLTQGEDARARGTADLAWGWLQKAIVQARAHDEPRVVAVAGRHLAELCADQGDTATAISLAQEARRAAEASWSRPDLAASDALLGRLWISQGNLDAGLRSLHLAVDMWGELGQVDQQLTCWRQIAAAHAAEGDLDEARVAWGRCLAVLQHRRDLLAQAELHAEVAAACARLGQIDLAITHALAALGRHRHLGHPAVSDDLGGLLELRGALGATPFREALSHHLDEDGLALVEALLDDEDLRRNPPPPPPPPPPSDPPPAVVTPAPPVPAEDVDVGAEEDPPEEEEAAPPPRWELPDADVVAAARASSVERTPPSPGLPTLRVVRAVVTVLFVLLLVALGAALLSR